MKCSRTMHIVSAHAGGEVGDVVTGEPITNLVLEAPGGLVKVRAARSGGRVTQVTIHNLRSFADMLDPEDPWPDGYRLSDTWPMSG